MKLVVVVNPQKPSTLAALRRIRQVVGKPHSLQIWQAPVAELTGRPDYDGQLSGYEEVHNVHGADIVVALGGDGTMLTAVRQLGDDLRPLLGINLGSLGFLTDTSEDDVETVVAALLQGRFELENRMLLQATCQTSGGQPLRLRGLNDVVLTAGPLARVLEFSMQVAGTDLGKTMADGVVVSTPSGSTAYNLSAGGPIVSPRLRALIMTPLSAHTLSLRPLVVDSGERIEIRLLRTSTARAELTIDGYTGCEMQQGQSVVVEAAPKDLQLVVTTQESFYDTLRRKLGWGGGRRTGMAGDAKSR